MLLKESRETTYKKMFCVCFQQVNLCKYYNLFREMKSDIIYLMQYLISDLMQSAFNYSFVINARASFIKSHENREIYLILRCNWRLLLYILYLNAIINCIIFIYCFCSIGIHNYGWLIVYKMIYLFKSLADF